jgi:hypothetical protein
MRAAPLPLLLLACSPARLPEPRFDAHPAPVDQWVIVQSAPPPVEVEEIGARPSGRHVWIDGQWAYQPVSRRWVWEQGRWCLPPANALFYARPALVRERRIAMPIDSGPWSAEPSAPAGVLVDDGWRWLKGSFYVRGPGSSMTPFQGTLECSNSTQG